MLLTQVPVSRLVLSLLLLVLAAGFGWAGARGLLNGEAFLPPGGAGDVGPITDAEGTTLRGRSARWAGVLFLALAAATLVGVYSLWR